MAVALDYQFDLNGFTMGQGTPLPSGGTIAFTEITGLDSPETDATVSQRASAHGAFVYARYLKERVITMQGRLDTTAESYAADTYYLKRIFQPTSIPVSFTFKLPSTDVQKIMVNPTGVRYSVTNVETAVGMVDFMATMVAGDPRIYSTSVNSLSAITPGSGGAGATFPVTFPLQFSVSGTSPAGTATNNGNFYAPTLFGLYGPLVNPRITNSTVGTSLQLTMTIPAATVVWVDSLASTVNFQGASRYSTLTSDSRFIELAPGDNSITMYADSGAGYADMAWSSTWI